MPKDEYIKVLNDKLYINDVAEYFNVTPEMVRGRGYDLKLLKRVFE